MVFLGCTKVAFKFNDFEATADQFHLLHTKYDVDPGPDSAANETQYTTDLAKTYKEGDKHSARILFLDVENKVAYFTHRLYASVQGMVVPIAPGAWVCGCGLGMLFPITPVNVSNFAMSNPFVSNFEGLTFRH